VAAEPEGPAIRRPKGPVDSRHAKEGSRPVKKIGILLAAMLLSFAVVACDNGGDDATDAPAASPAASAEA